MLRINCVVKYQEKHGKENWFEWRRKGSNPSICWHKHLSQRDSEPRGKIDKCSKALLHPSRVGKQTRRSGPMSTVTKKQHWAIIRATFTGLRTARVIRSTYWCTVSVRRVQQLMQKAPHLKCRKMQTVLYLTKLHQESRVKWAEDYVQWRTSWCRVIISDEKKFNLDDPNGFALYWYDLRKEQNFISKRQQGGSGVTIRAAMSYYGLSSIAVIDGSMDSEKYIQVLTKCLLPFAAEECPTDWIYQQDNPPSHASKATKQFLSDSTVGVLPWPIIYRSTCARCL